MVKGSIIGDEIVDYKLGAKADQTMSIKLKTSNASLYFNVLPPGSESALFIGSTSGNEWTGTLPVDGDYTVRVYLMRDAARRNERANYTLTVGITGGAAGSAPPEVQSTAPGFGGSERGAVADALHTPLAGTEWRLVEFQSMNDTVGATRPDDPSLYTMRLNKDGTVTMRLNCNHASGTWSAEAGPDRSSGRFEFGPLAATRALCPPPSMDESIAAQAKFIRSYLLEDGRLHLSLMADGGIYVWEPNTGKSSAAGVPATPEDGGPRDWEVTRTLNLREQPSTAARIVASYTPGTILDNLGCQRAEGRVWCDVQQLGGGPRGYVSAEFLKPAVSPDGSIATGPDDSALRAGQGKFDATGNIPCAQSVGQPMMQCEFGVARAGGGYATVVIKKPDGRTRAIFFRMGKPIGADTSQANGYAEFRTTKENDLHLIQVGNERYEIPDAVVLGG
ncbi:MAG: META domain-containing protein [Gammaproteobacteria bacterium]